MLKLFYYDLLTIVLRAFVNIILKIIYKLDCNCVYAQKHLTIIIKRWFYPEACLVGKRSRGLMNLVLMFFKVGGRGIWGGMLILES